MSRLQVTCGTTPKGCPLKAILTEGPGTRMARVRSRAGWLCGLAPALGGCSPPPLPGPCVNTPAPVRPWDKASCFAPSEEEVLFLHQILSP